jgi:lysophospholipid hydrolase
VDVLAALRACPSFATLRPDDLEGLDPPVGVRTLDPGAVLIEQDARPTELFVVVDGELEVLAARRVDRPPATGPDPTDATTPATDPAADDVGSVVDAVALLGPGDVVGEMAMLTGGPRDAAVRAITSVVVLSIAPEALDQLFARRPDVGARLAELTRARLRENRLRASLEGLVGPLDDAIVTALLRAVEWVTVTAGSTLFREGEQADAAYVVVSGRLRVLAEVGEAGAEDGDHRLAGDAEAVADLGRGEAVGELALLDAVGRRTATVVAIRDSELARITRSTFRELLDRRALLTMLPTLLARARGGAPKPVQADSGTIAVIASGPSVDLAAFTRALVGRLGRFGEVAHLTAERVDAELGATGLADADGDGPGALRLGSWLHELELRTPFVVLEVAAGRAGWSRRAVRQADQVLVVHDAASGPQPTPTEQQLEEAFGDRRQPTRVLVLLHPSDRRQPSGTAALLAERSVDQHLHVRLGHWSDLDRVARWVAGRQVGLVLGGGGAKGFAHLGVLRRLAELAVPIDAIAGSSMGAIMAATVGLDLEGEDPESFIAGSLSPAILDYTLPFVALARGRALDRELQTSFGELDLADLWVPFTCMATDLTAAGSRPLRAGPAWLALRASVAIPGVFPPVPWEEALLVDGGMADNLPAGVLRRQLPSGTLVAVDVAPQRGPHPREGVGTEVSGWGVLADRVVPWRSRRRVPSVPTTIMQAMMVTARQERDVVLASGVADLVLDLTVKGVGLLELGAVRPVAALGYELADERLTDFVAAHRHRW